jgi:hypothetical protein
MMMMIVDEHASMCMAFIRRNERIVPSDLAITHKAVHFECGRAADQSDMPKLRHDPAAGGMDSLQDKLPACHCIGAVEARPYAMLGAPPVVSRHVGTRHAHRATHSGHRRHHDAISEIEPPHGLRPKEHAFA